MKVLRRFRWSAALVAVLAAVMLPATAASAHATPIGSEPPDGAVVASAPDSLKVRFDERVDAQLASFVLHATDQPVVELSDVRIGSGGSQLVVTLPALPEGIYRVTYKVRDPVDLHETAGSVVFGVGNVLVASFGGATTVAPQPIDVVLRWLERVGLALLIGGALLALVVLPRLGDEVAAVRRSLRIVGVGATLQVVALVSLFVREVIDIGSPYGATAGRLLVSGSFGRRTEAGVVVAACLVGLTRLVSPSVDGVVLARWRARRFDEAGVALAAMTVAAALLVSLAGHASTGGSYPVGVALRLVHVLAMGAWAGGLFGAVFLRHQLKRPGAFVAVFSRLALVSMVALVATGLLLTGREIATVTALLSSWFGRLLLAKLAVLAAAGVWGVRHAMAVDRRRPVRARGLQIEGALALLVIAGGAALSTTPPAVGAFYERAPAPTPPPPAQTVGDVLVKLTLRPNRPGANLLVATVVSSRRPEPAPITGVSVEFRPEAGDAAPVPVNGGTPVDGVLDLGAIEIPSAGAYRVVVEVARPGASLAPVSFAWTVDAPQPARARTVVSDVPLRPYTYGGAAVAAVAGLALVVYRRRTGALPPVLGEAGDELQPAVSQPGRRDS